MFAVVLQIPVNLAAVPHLHDENDENVVANLIDDSIFSYPKAEETFVPPQNFRSKRPWIMGESTDVLVHPFLIFD